MSERFPIGTQVRVKNNGLGSQYRKESERLGEFKGVVIATSGPNYTGIPEVCVESTTGERRMFLVGDLEECRQEFVETGDMPEPVTDSEVRRIVTIKEKKYVVSAIVPARPKTPEAYVKYWSGGLLGFPSGPTRSASASSKPGSIGRAVWNAVND